LRQEIDVTKIVIPLVKMPEIYVPPAAKSQQQVHTCLSTPLLLHNLHNVIFWNVTLTVNLFHLICFSQIEIEGNALKHIKVKVRLIDDWTLVWESRNTSAINPVSIWAPGLGGSFLKRNKKAVCTGHYAVAGLSSGSSKPPKTLKGAMLIELTDKQTNTLSRSNVLDEQHVNFLMPHPVCRHFLFFVRI
jgi:hypothetical protein